MRFSSVGSQTITMGDGSNAFAEFLEAHLGRAGRARLEWGPSAAVLSPRISAAKPAERCTPLAAVVRTDNRPLGKAVTALAAVVVEMRRLTAEAEDEFCAPLHFCGEGGRGDVLAFSKFLPRLQRLSCFHQHCVEVVGNAVRQVAAARSAASVAAADAGQVLGALGGLLSAMVTVDEVVHGNGALKNHWAVYLKGVRARISDVEQGDTSEMAKLKQLDKVLTGLQELLYGRGLFLVSTTRTY